MSLIKSVALLFLLSFTFSVLFVTVANQYNNKSEINLVKSIYSKRLKDIQLKYEACLAEKETAIDSNTIKRVKSALKTRRAEFYDSELMMTKEYVQGYRGDYILIKLKDAIRKRILNFKEGEYSVENFKLYSSAINEFIHENRPLLTDSSNYQIFIEGSADIKGDKSFNRKFNNYKFEKINCLTKFDVGEFQFSDEERIHKFHTPLTNQDLPNLRAAFLKIQFDQYYAFDFKKSIILDGSVTARESKEDRNVDIILYLKE